MKKITIVFIIVVASIMNSCVIEDDNSCVNEGEEKIVICSTDNSKDQKQICQEGEWVNKGECICPEDNKFCYSHNGLDWSDTCDTYGWYGAIEYCENLGGRLPTVSELRALVKNCPATETGGECGVTDSCLSEDDCRNYACDGCEYDETNPGKYSVFGDIGWFWSSLEDSDWPGLAWYVNFSDGKVHGAYKDGGSIDVRCVK